MSKDILGCYIAVHTHCLVDASMHTAQLLSCIYGLSSNQSINQSLFPIIVNHYSPNQHDELQRDPAIKVKYAAKKPLWLGTTDMTNY